MPAHLLKIPGKVPQGWRREAPKVRSILALAAVRDYQLLHAFVQKTTGKLGPGVTLSDLPWDAIVRDVFTHAALAAGVPVEGTALGQQVYIELFNSTNTTP